MLRVIGLCFVLAALAASGAAAESRAANAIGDRGRGKALISAFACGGCHVIPGVRSGVGRSGPPLDNFGMRTTIAGVLPNTPAAMVRWLKNPQAVTPGNAMPNLGISQADARDMTAYLESLK
ncbi:MAG TPA: c-type cytochrome [Caulobacteraceae bacterium]|jgi:cytochrome c1|nr:c-type cytochrome [Caulobacteraceae bacterium]